MCSDSQDAVSLLVTDDTQRCQVEAYIASIYQRSYGANISCFMPVLMALTGEDGATTAALGLRRASQEALFLETYLDLPIDAALSEHTGQPVQREDLVEVGNFASHTAGGGRLLITALTALLRSNGFKWAVFTATPLLQRSFHRLGIHLVHIADADPARLGDARHEWGRYYDHPPAVMAVEVRQAADALHKILTLESSIESMRGVWRCAGSMIQQHNHSLVA